MDTLFLFLPLFITYLLLTDLKSPANAWAGLTLSLAAVGGVYSVAEHFHAGIMEKFVNPDQYDIPSNLEIKIFLLVVLTRTEKCRPTISLPEQLAKVKCAVLYRITSSAKCASLQQ